MLRISAHRYRKWHLSIVEYSFIAIGVFFAIVYAGALIHRRLSSHRALQEFDKAQAAFVTKEPPPQISLQAGEHVDFNQSSKIRILEYKASLTNKKAPLLAVLHFEKLNLRVPVFAGTDDLTLNRGVGWISGTARPGDNGNIGIAGHRDGFFRGLKDLRNGDAIDLQTLGITATYTVDEIEIVDPKNIGVLQPRKVPSLTLVTCYPFYFAGEAPLRFIIHAALKGRSGSQSAAPRSSNSVP